MKNNIINKWALIEATGIIICSLLGYYTNISYLILGFIYLTILYFGISSKISDKSGEAGTLSVILMMLVLLFLRNHLDPGIRNIFYIIGYYVIKDFCYKLIIKIYK